MFCQAERSRNHATKGFDFAQPDISFKIKGNKKPDKLLKLVGFDIYNQN